MTDHDTIKHSLKLTLKLECMGVHIEETKEPENIFTDNFIYKFSVPERSAVEGFETPDKLINEAKDTIYKMLIDPIKDEIKSEEEYNEHLEFVKTKVTFYARVRKGEIWDDEKIYAKIKEYKDLFNTYKDYEEV